MTENQYLNRRLLLSIFETSPVAIVVVDKEGRIILANPNAEKTLHLSRKDIQKRVYDDPKWIIRDFHGNPFPSEELPFVRVKNTLKPVSDFKHTVDLVDGTRIFLKINAAPLFDEENTFDGMIASIEDITTHISAGRALDDSQKMLESVFRAAPVGIGVVKDRILSWTNDKLHEITGYSAKDLEGNSSRMLYPSQQDFEYVGEEKYRQIKQFGTGTVETKWKRSDGRVIDVLLSSTPIDLNDLPRGVTFSALDITDRRTMEERLRQSEKMEAVGQLAGGIAHDFNNQLAGIMGYADILREEVGQNADLTRYADNVLIGVKRASDLTAQLLAFARKGKYLSVPVDIHRIVFEVVSLLKHSIDKSITIKQALNANPSTTKGDPSQLQNAILNLALNARDAMPSGGELIFQTDVVAFPEDRAPDTVYDITDGEYLKINVTDTGCGIDDTIKRKIFEPFFTTKETTKGTGLGLAAVYGTIQNHNGGIAVSSTPKSGTTFSLFLPLEKRPTDTANIQTYPSDNKNPLEKHILVVDDEKGVQEVVKDLLSALGCRTTLCSDGSDAIEIYRELSDEIDCIILDLIMPNMDGSATFQAIKAFDPNAQVLLSSGYSIDGNAQSLLAAGAKGFLQKPFRLAELKQTLKELFQET